MYGLGLDQKRMIRMQMDKIKEEGFFLPPKNDMDPNGRYLLVGIGGTGLAALAEVKRKVNRLFSREVINRQIRFLAVDTDFESFRAYDGKAIWRDDESVHLGKYGLAMLTHRNPDLLNEWFNPRLSQLLSMEMAECSTRGTRQLGRLALYPASSYDLFRAKLEQAAREVVEDIYGGVLNVCIFSGVAGGTGSGMVIDLTYLIRNMLEGLLVHRPININGFILLPPTGGSVIPAKIDMGNRNGYAAMKEINHYMRLQERGEAYSFQYGNGKTVRSKANLFDRCYLFDGQGDGEICDSPRKKALEDVSESILYMMMNGTNHTFTTWHGTGTFKTLTTWDRTQAKHIKNKLSRHTDSICMRDADYVYSGIGHTEFGLPSHQLKAYVAHGLFRWMYDVFANCDNVAAEHVKSIVDGIMRGDITSEVFICEALDREIEKIFLDYEDYGPFYVVDFLAELQDYVSSEMDRLHKKILVLNREAKLAALYAIRAHAQRQYHEKFSVYAAILDCMKELISAQYGEIVRTESTATGMRTVYSFIPKALNDTPHAHELLTYLQNLIIDEDLRKKLSGDLLRDMLDHEGVWLSIADECGGAYGKHMRAFWDMSLDRFLSDHFETMLVKLFGHSEMTMQSTDADDALHTAARIIYNELCGKGVLPGVATIPGGIPLQELRFHVYIMVPYGASRMRESLRGIVAEKGLQGFVSVNFDDRKDTISCVCEYIGIPAYKLAWTIEGERAYEESIIMSSSDGLHSSESVRGRQWRNYPNLLPKSSRHLRMDGYINHREQANAEEAERAFDAAEALGLVRHEYWTESGFETYYSVAVLPAEVSCDDAVLNRLFAEDRRHRVIAENGEGYIAWEAENLAARLFARNDDWTGIHSVKEALKRGEVLIEWKDLYFPLDCLTYGPDAAEAPDDWAKQLAKRNLRRMPELLQRVRYTNMVIGKLMEKIAEENRRNAP